VGRSVIKVYDMPQELVDAQAVFNERIPKLKEIRDPLTHPNDNDELDDVGWFSSVGRLGDDGRFESFVDPRYDQQKLPWPTAQRSASTSAIMSQQPSQPTLPFR